MRYLKISGRAVALWLAMVFGTMLSGILVHPVPHHGLPDGPLSVWASMLVVNGTGAVIVSALSLRLRASGLRKAAILFVIVFALETGLSWIEAVAFRKSLGLTDAALSAMFAAGLIRALTTAGFAALLLPGSGEPVPGRSARLASVAAVTALYVALYFSLGMLVAWRSEAVRNYYHGGAFIDARWLVALQIARGLLWTGLAALLSARLRGRDVYVALLTGAAFAVLMVAPLLYPNAIMPWAVRRVHLEELAMSNAIFGVLAVLALRRRKPLFRSTTALVTLANAANRTRVKISPATLPGSTPMLAGLSDSPPGRISTP